MGRIESASKRWLHLAIAFVVLLAVVTVAGPLPARGAIDRDVFEECLLDSANEARAAAGVPDLKMATDLVPVVREWSEWMRFNEFKHMSYSQQQDVLPASTTTWGENIAMQGYADMADCTPIHTMWLDSAGHRANILSQHYRYVAIGTFVDDSGWWATQLFFDASDYHPTCTGIFCDDDGSVFETSIERLSAAGITNGCNPTLNNLYCPDDRVTRGAMAAFLSRALQLPDATGKDFVDDDDSVFEDAIERIAAAGITQGCNPPSNTRFCPDDYITRGQMAAFITRAFDL